MEAIFFRSRTEEATGVACSDDLPGEPVADALSIEDPSPLVGLSRLLGVDRRPRPLRDATCRSFPVWSLGQELSQKLGSLANDEIEDLAERWLAHDETTLDADLYQLSGCLEELRDAANGSEGGESLFVLLEERAW